MKILESFPHLINPAVPSHNVLYFMSFKVYQETLLFVMDALFPSILKLKLVEIIVGNRDEGEIIQT